MTGEYRTAPRPNRADDAYGKLFEKRKAALARRRTRSLGRCRGRHPTDARRASIQSAAEAIFAS